MGRVRLPARGTGLNRVAGLAPGAEAAVERDGTRETHAPERRRSDGRDLAELAVRENSHRGIRKDVVDTQLELAAWDVQRPRHVTARVLIRLADVEHRHPGIAALDPAAQLVHRHERD